LAIAILFGVYVFQFSKARLVFCDVGQGTGVLLSYRQFQFVYDTGPKNGKFLSCLSKNMPFWDKRIEVMVISHWDSDHSGGLSEVIDYYRIDNLYSSQENEQINFSNILALGDVIKTSWMEFLVLWTDSGAEPNYGSVVGLLEIGDFKSLLMGDVPIEVEQRLVWRKILKDEVDVLLVGHHGSKSSTSQELLNIVKAKEAVISVGKNSFGHPSKEILDRLSRSGVIIKRTDGQGDVVYSFVQ
jgi:competence protein ComEC